MEWKLYKLNQYLIKELEREDILYILFFYYYRILISSHVQEYEYINACFCDEKEISCGIFYIILSSLLLLLFLWTVSACIPLISSPQLQSLMKVVHGE